MSTPASSLPEVPYAESDLKNTKKPGLVAIVKRQAAKWPGPDVYDAKATTVRRLKAVLLDSRYGFTRPSSPSTQDNSPPMSPLTQNDNGTPRATPEPQTPATLTRPVKLLIQDARTSTKMAQTVPLVVVVDHDDSGPGEWQAGLHDLLSRLQDSNSAIIGPVRISYRDPVDTEYWVPFIKVTTSTPLEEVQTEPTLVSIPSSLSLELRVEHVSFALILASLWLMYNFKADLDTIHPNTASSAVLFDMDDPAWKPLEHARSRTSIKDSSKKKDDDNDVEWLKGKFETLPGYQEFRDNQRKVQTNPGIVRSWGFIANASETYFGKVSHVQGRKKIQQASINKALRLGSSAVSEAKNATRILKLYGPGGTSPAREVIDRVNLIEDPPQGAAALYPFLRDWAKEHNMDSTEE
ncbi:hypothetical protein C8F04DRAFT_1331866 [Mycena alexandri]|uniref:Uncharacterized protein n=1 Tax=Mycena alexandri TaxID=1745969 RepID=A0AAD6WMB0_9AGAR|nr:hypothetical protein C8F04DRAFT_1331866 [Mycena alexandri]